MPFTFSHPAIIIPFLNKKSKLFSTTGLVVGSLIPDFESFIRFSEHKIYSHTWPGIFWFDLPLGLIATFIFHNLVRDPLINNLPDIIGDKFKPYKGFTWYQYFKGHAWKVIYSMVLGITLHLLWDAFTHLNLANPDATDSDIYLWGTQVFKLLQDANSVLGLGAVVWYVAFMPVQETLHEEQGRYIYTITTPQRSIIRKVKFWAVAAVTEVITVLLCMVLFNGHMSFVLFIDVNISGSLLGLILAAILMRDARE